MTGVRGLTNEQRALAERYIPLALKLASRFEGRSTSIDPEDLQQVALTALCEAAARFSPERGTSPAQFFGPAIKGALSDYVRASFTDRIRLSDRLSVLVESPCNNVDAVDSADAFAALIESAPPKYQDLLWLVFAVGLTQAEVAGRFGVTQPYIAKLLREALMCLAGEAVVRYHPGFFQRAKHA